MRLLLAIEPFPFRGYVLHCHHSRRWVLTVPAIWDDEARSFMRFAAEKAGIVGGIADHHDSELPSRFALALEPEAAAIAAVPAVRSPLPACVC